ncbi:MAG: glycosyltransferase family 4 protein [Candidatus Neomarinimicrobiota bacterium]
MFQFIFNYIANKSPDIIICDGALIKSSLDPIVKIKTKVILNGIDIKNLEGEENKNQRVRDEFNIPNNAYVIGHIGRMTPWKGQEILLDAFISYSKINCNAYLLLIGSPVFDNDKYFKKIRNKISKNFLEEKIILPGYRSDLNAIYYAMDLFVFPSLEKDTSPLSLLGAMVSGLPIAISSIPSLREIDDLILGLESFDTNEESQLLNIFLKFENKVYRKRTGEMIKKQAINTFGMSRHTDDVLKFIEQSLNKNSIN